MSEWHVYIVRTRLDTLYTGIATDVQRRLAEHESGTHPGAKYLRGKGPLELVFVYRAGGRDLASRIEHRIKSLSRGAKNQLLNQVSPDNLLPFLGLTPEQLPCGE